MKGARKKAHPVRRNEGAETPRHYYLAGRETAAPALEPALYLVATPIGNLADITLRALGTLAAADILACEDTRVTRILLDRYGISRRTAAYHEHNAATSGPRLIRALEEGKSVALVSDAGTPLVSDPGYRLVREAIERAIPVVPIPGPSSALAALQASGMPSDAFFFAGFLPSRSGQRRSRLAGLEGIPATLILFESPRRLASSLSDMAELLGADRGAAVCRELTKSFEEIRRATLGELAAHYQAAGAPRGEVVVVIGPHAGEISPDPEGTDRLLRDLAARMPASRAAAEAARLTGIPRPELYRRLVALKAGRDE